MLFVNLIDIGICILGRFFCLCVELSSSISLGNADHTSTLCPEFSNIRDNAIPHVPAPSTPIFIIYLSSINLQISFTIF